MANHYLYRDGSGNFKVRGNISNTYFYVYTPGVSGDIPVDGIPAPISGFSYSISDYDFPMESCYDSSSSVGYTFNVPSDESSVEMFVIRRAITTPVYNSAGTYAYGFDTSHYAGPRGIQASGLYGVSTVHVTNFEPFIVTSTSGTGSTFKATTVYESGSSFYYDYNSGDTNHANTLGVTKIEFSQEFGPKITFRSSSAKTNFVSTHRDMYIYVADSNYSGRPYVGYHALQNNRISDQDSTSVTYSGTPALNITMSGINELLTDLESNGTNHDMVYIQIEYDYTENLIDDCDLSVGTRKSPFIVPKWAADALFRSGDQYNFDLTPSPGCGYHSYQIFAVNASGQSIEKPNDSLSMTTWGSGWVFKGGQEWQVQDSAYGLKFTYGTSGIGFSGECRGINGPEFIVYNHYVSGVLYDLNDSVVSSTSSPTPGVIEMGAPSNGWYTFKAFEGWVVAGPSSTILCEKETSMCNNLATFPYEAIFYVYNGDLAVPPVPTYPQIN